MILILAKAIHLFFLTYTIFLFVRVIGSWFPRTYYPFARFMQFVSFYTDPYLNTFRRVIPPIGGTLDLSPVLGFFALGIIEKVLLKALCVFL